MSFIEDKTTYESKARRLITRMIERVITNTYLVFNLKSDKIRYKLSYKEPCWSIHLGFRKKELELQICCLDRKASLESIYLDRVIDNNFHWDGLANSYLDVVKFIEQSILLLVSDTSKL